MRVHPEIKQAQRLPDGVLNQNTLWRERYRSIIDMENHLHRNGTRIIKFFLHLSKEEQRKRYIAHIDNQDKNCKLSLADIEERKHWKQYMHAYEQCLDATSTSTAPWHIIPADEKKNARLFLSKIILDTFRSLDISYPSPGEKRRRELQMVREQLAK